MLGDGLSSVYICTLAFEPHDISLESQNAGIAFSTPLSLSSVHIFYNSTSKMLPIDDATVLHSGC